MTFKHGGDLGDLIYALPTIKALGGGDLFLDGTAVHPNRGGPRVPLTMEAAAPILPLLNEQPYIHSVQPWEGGKVDVDFTPFRMEILVERRDMKNRELPLRNLAIVQAGIASRSLGGQSIQIDGPWLTLFGMNYEDDVIFARSARYHNPRFPWRGAIEKYAGRATFLGLPVEHAAFCEEFGITAADVPYYPTANLLEAAQVINECSLFIGGQSCLYPIAEGLGKRAVLEVWPVLPSNLFFREGVVHGWNEHVVLPEIDP